MDTLMKYRFVLLCILLSAMTMTSCSESDDKDDEYANWESRNNVYFENIYQQAKSAIDSGDESWMIIKSWSKDGALSLYTAGAEEGTHTDYIVAHVESQSSYHDECKVLTEQSLATPLYTDTVRLHYRGWLMPSASYSEGKQFDSSWQGDYDTSTMVPAKLSVSGMINGFTTVLMSMHVGDRWTVYIPWQLAYGSSSTSSSIPNCSVLRFDMTLQSYWKAGTTVSTFK